MSDYTTMIPATGCLEASWKMADPENPRVMTRHYPVCGLRGEHLVPVIELNGRPATATELETWLAAGGDMGLGTPLLAGGPPGSGWPWLWLPACECRGQTTRWYPIGEDEIGAITHIDDIGCTPDIWPELTADPA